MKKRWVFLPLFLLCCLLCAIVFYQSGGEADPSVSSLVELSTTEEPTSEVGISAVEKKYLALISRARIAAAGIVEPVELPDSFSIAAKAEEEEEESIVSSLAAGASSLGLEEVKDLCTDTEAAINNTIAWMKQDSAYVLNEDILAAAGSGDVEWLAMALGRYGYPDQYDAYLEALETYVTQEYAANGYLHRVKTTEWHRVTFAVLGLGGDPTAFGTNAAGSIINLIADGAYDCIPTTLWGQGINGAIYGLLVVDSLDYEIPAGAKYQRDDIIDYILVRQKDDGGFALSGTTSDPDITAMALQSLAPYVGSETVYGNGKTVGTVVEEALAWLSSVQKEEGDFDSWGYLNSESTSQTIMALCCLGIDPDTDERFIKNGNSLMDGLMKYYNTEDGGFVHSFTVDPENPTAVAGESNEMATEQARRALIAYYRLVNGYNSLYDFTEEADRTATELNAIIRNIAGLPNTATLADEAEIIAVARSFNLLNDSDKAKINNQDRLETILAQLDALKNGDDDDDDDPQDGEISAAAAALDKEIGEKIYPVNITLNDASLVTGLWERYQALSDTDKSGMENGADLVLAKKIIDGLKNNIVIKEVFDLIAGNDIDYKITGIIDDKYEYTITFNGMEISEPKDFDARILFTAAKAERIALRASDATYIQFVHQGTFPGKADVSLSVKAKDGTYMLYYYDATADDFEFIKRVTITGSGLSFSANRGGDYFLTAKTVSKNLRSYSSADFTGGIVPASVFEEIMGENVNLVLEGETEDGIAYKITFNGKDIKNPMDFNMNLSFVSEAEEYILQLAENPFIIHFEHEGEMPGEAMVELTKVTLDDGGFLLFYYNAEEMKAEYEQKVEVATGETRFILTHCSDFFIATRAKAGSLLDQEEAVSDTALATAPNASHLPWIIGGGILLLIVAMTIVVLWQKKRRTKKRKGEMQNDQIGE